MNKFTLREKFLLRCSGVDLATMSETKTTEVNRYLIIGVCVLIPTILALFTGGYTIFIISNNIWAALVFAPVWSWIIFTLDRAIVANTTTNKITWSVLGRTLLALCISVLISQPVELIAFKDVIKEKKGIELQLKKDSACVKIDSIINETKSEIKTSDSITNQKRNVLINEVDKGDIEHKRKPGIGKHAIFDQNQLTIDSLRNEKSKNLLNRKIDSLNIERINRINEVEQNDPNGLLGQLELLHAVVRENSTVKIAVWFFFFFFLIIELIPIIIKLDSNSKGIDLYNTIKEKNEQICKNAHDNMKEQKEELFEAEQLLLINQRIQKIDLLIQKNTIKEASKNYSFFMQTIKATGEEIKKIESQIVKHIKNEAVREHLLAQVLRLFYEFSNSLEKLVKNLNTKMETENNIKSKHDKHTS